MSQTDEFDQLAEWTAEAIERLGSDHALPGACRGSGGPGVLDWLAGWLTGGAPTALLDVGAGLGGPSAWMDRHLGLRPVMAEPMLHAALGARRLFGIRGVVTAAEALPFADGTFPAAWCLGVLSTVADVRTATRELARVVQPGGRVGLVVYVTTDRPVDGADGDHFSTWIELAEVLDAAGLVVSETVRHRDLPPTDTRWEELSAAVERDLAAHHGTDPAYIAAQSDQGRVEQLMREDRVIGLAVRATVRPGGPGAARDHLSG